MVMIPIYCKPLSNLASRTNLKVEYVHGINMLANRRTVLEFSLKTIKHNLYNDDAIPMCTYGYGHGIYMYHKPRRRLLTLNKILEHILMSQRRYTILLKPINTGYCHVSVEITCPRFVTENNNVRFVVMRNNLNVHV